MVDHEAPQVVRNSPIEFVISGPVAGRDRVLVRTEMASLDLVAIAAQGTELDRRHPSSDPFVALFGGDIRQLNVVTSISVPDFRKEADTRRSSLNFAWVGLTSSLRTEQIQEAFNHCLPDLFDALTYKSAEDVEFSIAPVVLACSEAHERRRSVRRSVFAILSAYALIGIGVSVYLLLN